MKSLDDFAKSDLDRLEKLAQNFRWIYSHSEYLKQKYEKQYVAIKDEKILDKDSKLERLVNRLNITNYDKSIAIDFISR